MRSSWNHLSNSIGFVRPLVPWKDKIISGLFTSSQRINDLVREHVKIQECPSVFITAETHESHYAAELDMFESKKVHELRFQE